MRLLITGAAGRLGWRTVQALAGCHEIVAFDRADVPACLPASVRYIQADLRDADRVREAARGAEAILHLGAIPGPLHYFPQAEIFQINVQGTYHVLESAARAEIRMVVVASSLCAIGIPSSLADHGLTYLPVDEDHPCRPRDAYDLSKLVTEQTAAMFTRRCGITTICLRFPALADVHGSGWVAGEIRKETPRLVLCDYLDFQDAIRVMEIAMTRRDLAHEVLFVNATTIGTTRPTPEYVQRFSPRLDWHGAPPMDTTPLINCAKLERILGFTPAITWQQAPASGFLPQP